MMPMFFFILLLISVMCVFHFRCWSMWTPRNFVVKTSGMILLSIISSLVLLGISFFVERKII